MATLLPTPPDDARPPSLGRCHALRFGATGQVSVAGELCVENTGALEDAALRAGVDSAERLVLDLTAVTFADAAAVAALLGVAGRAAAHDVPVVVVVAPGPVADLLSLTGATARLDVVVDRR
jgi:anti-anti-sigma factor